MKRGAIIGGGIVAVLIVVAVAAVVYILGSLDTLIQEAVEKYGTEITRAEVRLNEVEIDLGSGKGALRGLSVGNPSGFKTPTSIKLGLISVTVDTSTLTSDPVVIKEVVIGKPDITYEIGADGSNITAIENNVDAYMKKRGLAGDGAAKSGGAEGPKLIIENLYVRDGTVNVSATILEGKTLSAPLPDIHLKDIGKEQGGAAPAEIAEEVLSSITGAAGDAAGGLGIGDTLESLGKSLEGVGAGVGEAVDGVAEGASGAAEIVTEGISEGVEGAGETLKKLLGD